MNKRFISIIALSFLIQSCYSYKSIDLKKTSLAVGKKYKIQQNNKFIKVELIGLNYSIANFKTKDDEKQINLSELQKLKERKFSVTKTVLLPISIILGSTTIMLTTGGSLIRVGGSTSKL